MLYCWIILGWLVGSNTKHRSLSHHYGSFHFNPVSSWSREQSIHQASKYKHRRPNRTNCPCRELRVSNLKCTRRAVLGPCLPCRMLHRSRRGARCLYLRPQNCSDHSGSQYYRMCTQSASIHLHPYQVPQSLARQSKGPTCISKNPISK